MKLKKIFFTITFLLLFFFVFAQGNLKTESGDIFYKIITGVGVGKGSSIGKSFPSNSSNIGLGLNINFELQTKSLIHSVGYRIISDFEILNRTKGKNRVRTAEVTFGKSFSRNLLSLSISSGISNVTFVKQDVLLREYSEGTGLFNIYREYSLYKTSYFGVPISLKLFFELMKQFSAGVEFYANINGESNFFSLNLTSQLTLLRR
jgi:hypothetical protein